MTNALLHAATPMCVTLHILSDRIRIDVADGSTSSPAIKEYGPDAATGRGLTLFNTLAADWGVQSVPGGKIVWFELPVVYDVPPTSVSDGSFRFDIAGVANSDLGRRRFDRRPPRSRSSSSAFPSPSCRRPARNTKRSSASFAS